MKQLDLPIREAASRISGVDVNSDAKTGRRTAPGRSALGPHASALRSLTPVQKLLLDAIKKRGKSNPVSYHDLADWLKVSPRVVRREVEELVRIHKQPIMSSYSTKAPGYFWPQTPEEVREVCGRLIRHGAAIIKRARTIGKYSDEEVMGQLRIVLKDDDQRQFSREDAKTRKGALIDATDKELQ